MYNMDKKSDHVKKMVIVNLDTSDTINLNNLDVIPMHYGLDQSIVNVDLNDKGNMMMMMPMTVFKNNQSYINSQTVNASVGSQPDQDEEEEEKDEITLNSTLYYTNHAEAIKSDSESAHNSTSINTSKNKCSEKTCILKSDCKQIKMTNKILDLLHKNTVTLASILEQGEQVDTFGFSFDHHSDDESTGNNNNKDSKKDICEEDAYNEDEAYDNDYDDDDCSRAGCGEERDTDQEEETGWSLPSEILRKIRDMGLQDGMKTKDAINKITEALQELQNSWDEDFLPEAEMSSNGLNTNNSMGQTELEYHHPHEKDYRSPAQKNQESSNLENKYNMNILTLCPKKDDLFLCDSVNCSGIEIPEHNTKIDSKISSNNNNNNDNSMSTYNTCANEVFKTLVEKRREISKVKEINQNDESRQNLNVSSEQQESEVLDLDLTTQINNQDENQIIIMDENGNPKESEVQTPATPSFFLSTPSKLKSEDTDNLIDKESESEYQKFDSTSKVSRMIKSVETDYSTSTLSAQNQKLILQMNLSAQKRAEILDWVSPKFYNVSIVQQQSPVRDHSLTPFSASTQPPAFLEQPPPTQTRSRSRSRSTGHHLQNQEDDEEISNLMLINVIKSLESENEKDNEIYSQDNLVIETSSVETEKQKFVKCENNLKHDLNEQEEVDESLDKLIESLINISVDLAEKEIKKTNNHEESIIVSSSSGTPIKQFSKNNSQSRLSFTPLSFSIPLRKEDSEEFSCRSITPFVNSIASMSDVLSGDDIKTRCSTASTITEFEYSDYGTQAGELTLRNLSDLYPMGNRPSINDEKFLDFLAQFNKINNNNNSQNPENEIHSKNEVNNQCENLNGFNYNNNNNKTNNIPDKNILENLQQLKPSESKDSIQFSPLAPKPLSIEYNRPDKGPPAPKSQSSEPSSPSPTESMLDIKNCINFNSPIKNLRARKPKPKKGKKKVVSKYSNQNPNPNEHQNQNSNSKQSKNKPKKLDSTNKIKMSSKNNNNNNTSSKNLGEVCGKTSKSGSNNNVLNENTRIDKLKQCLPRTSCGKYTFTSKEAQQAIAEYVKAELEASLIYNPNNEQIFLPMRLKDVLESVTSSEVKFIPSSATNDNDVTQSISQPIQGHKSNNVSKKLTIKDKSNSQCRNNSSNKMSPRAPSSTSRIVSNCTTNNNTTINKNNEAVPKQKSISILRRSIQKINNTPLKTPKKIG